MVHRLKFGDGLLATAACGYALWASVVVLVKGYGPWCRILLLCYGPQRQTNYHGTEPHQYIKSLSNFLKAVRLKSSTLGLCHPCVKSLVSAKKIGSPHWPIVQNEFQIRIIGEKNLVYETGFQKGSVGDKS
jgi:hypothetical protein